MCAVVSMITALMLPLLAVAADDVVTLTSPSAFDKFIKENPVCLVQFYTPWCAKCKEFAPDWATLATKAQALANPVPLALIDAKEHKEVADRFNVYGFPSIHTFNQGKDEEFEGKREVEALFEHITKVSTFKPPQLLSTAAEVEKFAASAKSSNIVLGLFRQPVAASAAFKTFSTTLWELARSGHTIAAAYSAAYGAPPVLPLTADGKKPPVPSLVQLDAKGKAASKVMPLPRKKEDFTQEKVVEWLNDAGISAEIAEKPNDYPEKDYSDPDDPDAASEGSEEDGEGYPEHDDDHFD